MIGPSGNPAKNIIWGWNIWKGTNIMVGPSVEYTKIQFLECPIWIWRKDIIFAFLLSCHVHKLCLCLST